MNWTIVAVVVSIIVPALGLLNAYLLIQIKVEISGLKLETLQQRMQDKEDVRAWFKAEIETRLQSFSLRFERLENRRRAEERAA